MTPALWDSAVLVLVLLAAVRGAWRGGAREAFSLLGLGSGIVAGWWWASHTGELTPAASGPSGTGGEAIVFVVVAVGFWAVGGLLGWLVERFIRSTIGRVASAVFGAAFGASKGVLLAGMCLVFLYLFVPGSRMWVNDAPLADAVLRVAVAAGQELIRVAGNGG